MASPTHNPRAPHRELAFPRELQKLRNSAGIKLHLFVLYGMEQSFCLFRHSQVISRVKLQTCILYNIIPSNSNIQLYRNV